MKTYKIHFYNGNEWEDFGGGYTIEEVKQFTKGYKAEENLEGFYTRKNSKKMYDVRED